MDTVPGWFSPAEDEPPDWGPCPSCGTANAAAARFCQACGRPLVDPGPDPMTIDVLTAVVAELVSANDAFALAPDADDRLVAVRDTFIAAGAILRDLPARPHTVAAVFGPAPRDGISTLTAVRSALAARHAATGGDVALRLGIGASDVRGDDDEAVDLWRGRVVDLALRLSTMAGPGEVILGEGAYRLIRDAVVAEPVDPRADPEGDDVGPLRVHGIREMDAWAVQPEPVEQAESAAETTADASIEAPPAPVSSSDVAAAPPGWDMWSERFGTAPAEGELGSIEPPAHEADAGAWTEPAAQGELTDPAHPIEARETFEDTADEAPAAAAEDALPSMDPQATVADQEAPIEQGPASPEPDGTALLEREAVLGRLHEALNRAIDRGRPVVVAVGGEPGCGRTAAVRWFASLTADRAGSVEVACRPADAGGTSWPFAALVRAVAGIDGPIGARDLEARLREAMPADEAAAAVLTASLLGDRGAPPEETRGALAALLSATVARRPLIVIVDDADRAWATSRSAFDAVVERVDGPLLVVAIGRGSADVVVPPLSDHASAELVERLLARPNLPPDAMASIVTACGGLPLAVEHLVAMLADDGHLRWEYGRWTPTVDLASLPLPADLPSLVARRVGGLGPAERRVAAAAALAGARFDPAVVASAIDTDVEEVLDACTSLADRGILRRSGDGFAFGHDVLADASAAYVEREAARAIHVAAADRLDRDGPPGLDVVETIGAHLEHAFRLSGTDAAREALGRRAADHLVRAASGAADVGDEDGSLALLRRAAAVLPPEDAGRALLLLDSATTLAAWDERTSAERLLGDAIRAARAAGDELVEVRALVARARMLAVGSRIGDRIEALRDAAEAAIAIATVRQDPITASAGWSARGWVHTVRGHFAGAADAFEHAADAAAAAGRRRDELSALRELAGAIVDGPAPGDEGIERCGALVERARGTAVEADAASALAVLLARAGRADEAARTLDRVAELHAAEDSSTTIAIRTALVALHAGAPERAEAPLRTAHEKAARSSDRGATLALLAYVLTELGRTDEAIPAADEATSLADRDDVVSQVTWRAAKARCLAAAGRHREARALVRLALRLADQTDLSELRARTRLDLAEVLLASGRANEARPAARAALRALERKGSITEAARARSILDRAARKSAQAASEDETADRASPHAESPTWPAHMSPVPGAVGDPSAPLDQAGASEMAQPTPAAEPVTSEEPADGSKRDRHWFW